MIQLVFWTPPPRQCRLPCFDFAQYNHWIWPGPTWLWDSSFDHICCFPVPLV